MDRDRRLVLNHAAKALLAGTVVGMPGGRSDAGAEPPSQTIAVARSRSAIFDRRDVAMGDLVYLSESGREGLFEAVAGPAPVADRLQGLFVPSSASGLCFRRVWDGTHGRPEWFGAVTNDWHADCADAIEACYALCPVTELGQADYFVRRSLRFAHSWRTVRGVGNFATDQGRGTRIILQGSAPDLHSADIIVVGSVAQPSNNSEDFPYENHFSHFTVIRDGVSAAHPSGDPARYPTGVRAAFLVRSTFRSISSLASSIGFYFGGCIYTKVDDCLAQRTDAGIGEAPDLAIGYYLDGRPTFGMAGGNASLYIDRCVAVGQHPHHVRPTGLVAEGAFVDTFLDRFESARIDTGITFATKGATALGQTVDVHVRSAVLDGCGRFGIDIDLAGTQTAAIEIIDPYVYAAGSGGDRGILIHDGAGLVTVTGGQVHGAFAGGSLWLSHTRGVRVQGLKIQEAAHPVVVAASGALQLEPQISNVALRTPSFAVVCADMYRSSVRPIVMGVPGAFAGGVSLDGGCNYSLVDGTAIDPGCFGAVDGALKLRFGSDDVGMGESTGAFSRAHNVLAGVTG